MSYVYTIDYAPSFSPNCAAELCHRPITARTLRIGFTHYINAGWRHWDCASCFQLKVINEDEYSWESASSGLLPRDIARVQGDLRRGYMLGRDLEEGDKRVREWEMDDSADWEWKVKEVGRWGVGEGDEVVERWRAVMEKRKLVGNSKGTKGEEKSVSSGTPTKIRSRRRNKEAKGDEKSVSLGTPTKIKPGRRSSPRFAAARQRTSPRIAAAKRRMLW